MAEYPEVQTKVQSEIDRKIGRKRVPTIDDRGTLPYTEATLYEVIRYNTISPISVPHATTKDTVFRELGLPFYFIEFDTLSSMFSSHSQFVNEKNVNGMG